MAAAVRKATILQFVLNWQRVRQLAKLSILNRLTLTMLIIVPLITAFWPTLQTTSQGYNRALSATRQRLEIRTPAEFQESQQLEEPIAGVGGWIKSFWSQSPLVETRLEAYAIEKLPQPVPRPSLPRTWAMAFFAALSILFADTVFQLFCPLIVRRQSAENYANAQVALFAAAPSSVSLEQNIERLIQLQGEPQQLAQNEREWQQQLKEDTQQLERMLSAVEADIAKAASEPASTPDMAELRQRHEHLQSRYRMLSENNQGRRTDEMRRQFGIIELGNLDHYNQLSLRSRFAILITMAGYLTGGCVILKILQEQAFKVATAAGWL